MKKKSKKFLIFFLKIEKNEKKVRD